MTNFHKMTLTGAAACALMLSVSAPAFASSAMCADKSMMTDTSMARDAMATPMATDTMMKDDKMADTTMAKDAMGKDAVADDKMKTGTMAMADDKMATPMAADAMKSDSMAKDAMVKDDKMAGAMMGEYTVKSGDSLWSIAASEMCDGAKYPMIVSANADMLGGGKMVHPGQVLHIPGD